MQVMTAANPQQDPWTALSDELDAWSAAARVATFWWRDDDAIKPGPKLDRLVNLTGASGLLLAVIPAQAGQALADTLAGTSHVWVGQHGYAHTNHAKRGVGQGAWELGLHRGVDTVMSELEKGRAHLHTLFGSRFLPVVIPPWNHMAPELLKPLSQSGYCGVSLFGARHTEAVPSELTVVNAHCDPVKWKTGPRFTGETKAIAQLVEHLAARRTGAADAAEATGLLTHHIDLDEQSWSFCTRAEQLISAHPAARWCHPDEIFRVSQ